MYFYCNYTKTHLFFSYFVQYIIVHIIKFCILLFLSPQWRLKRWCTMTIIATTRTYLTSFLMNYCKNTFYNRVKNIIKIKHTLGVLYYYNIKSYNILYSTIKKKTLFYTLSYSKKNNTLSTIAYCGWREIMDFENFTQNTLLR